MRTVPAALVLVAGALPASAAATPAPLERAAGYTTYVACSLKTSAEPAHQCKLSDPKAAFFRSAGHDATYKVCVRFPGKKKRLCAAAQDAPKGRTRSVSIATSKLGKHRVWWYVDGRQVGTWRFDVVAGRGAPRAGGHAPD